MPRKQSSPVLASCGTACGTVEDFLDEASIAEVSEEECTAMLRAEGMTIEQAAAKTRDIFEKAKRAYLLSQEPAGKA